jgi:Putative beta-barrel porin 2
MIARLGNTCRPIRQLGLWLGSTSLALLWHGTAHSQSLVQPYAEAGYQYDSNLFALPADITILGYPAGTKESDSTYKVVGGVHSDLHWALQDLTVDVEGRKFDYDNHTYLDHYEWLLSGKYSWVATSFLDGTLAVREERLLEPFTQQVSTVIGLETDKSADASVRIGLQPRWHLDLEVKPHELEAPQPNLPNFRLRETTSTLTLDWQVVSKLTVGADANYVQGGYYGGPTTLPYRENSQNLTLKYVATGLSTLNAAFGRSAFDTSTAQGGNTSASTGTVGYTRNLTGKTSITIQFTRALDTYIAAGNSSLDTSGLVTVDWSATRKISVALTGSETHSQFAGKPVVAVYPVGLKDHYFTGELNLTYQATTWLSAQLYGQYQTRTANSPFFTFNDKTIGFQLRTQFGVPVGGQ